MSGFILLVCMIVLIVTGEGNIVFWGVGIIAALFIAASVGARFAGRAGSSEKPRTRIERPHYISEDEYECGICGKRFDSPLSACPYCGVRFNRTETDEREYDDELEEEMDMDEDIGL